MSVLIMPTKRKRVYIKGDKARAVIHCCIDPQAGDDCITWSAVLNWAKGGIKNHHIISKDVGGIVVECSALIKKSMSKLKAFDTNDKVDIDFKMPMGKHHILTIFYKDVERDDNIILAQVDPNKDPDMNVYD